MTEHDPLHSLLQEWKAPVHPPTLAARALAAYRKSRKPTLWERLWSLRVSIPVPVLAAAVLMIAAGLWLERRMVPPQRPTAASPAAEGFMTRLETAGFQPLPNGEIRVIRSGVKQ